MRVRAIRACSQRLFDGDRVHRFRDGWEGEWNCSGELPKCFRRLDKLGNVIPDKDDEPAKIAVTQAKPEAPPILQALDRDAQVVEALNRLDHEDSGLWTDLGLPRVEAVALELEALGFDSQITRAEINVASPGFQRRPTQ